MVAAEYWLVAAAVARTVQVPTEVKVMIAVNEPTEQPVVPALRTEYVIAPLPFVVARDDGVEGDDGSSRAVVGLHDTT